MDLSSWFRRTLLKNSTKIKNPDLEDPPYKKLEAEDELLGLTEQLIDLVKSFTIDTFKNFPLQDDEGATCGDETPTTSGSVRKDLSEWQERHATLVLLRIKEISQLRYMLCPRHLKERQFWKIYFKLVKKHVTEYELCTVQLEKLKSMAMESEKPSDTSAYEIEMAETKQPTSLAPPTP